jgi:hypothetical protein
MEDKAKVSKCLKGYKTVYSFMTTLDSAKKVKYSSLFAQQRQNRRTYFPEWHASVTPVVSSGAPL